MPYTNFLKQHNFQLILFIVPESIQFKYNNAK